MAKLFLYTKETGLTAKSINALVEAGYVPIQVKDETTCRIVEVVPDADINAILHAALKAIRDAPYDQPRTLFAEFMCNNLLAIAERDSPTKAEG